MTDRNNSAARALLEELAAYNGRDIRQYLNKELNRARASDLEAVDSFIGNRADTFEESDLRVYEAWLRLYPLMRAMLAAAKGAPDA